jgi:hypothetical protein
MLFVRRILARFGLGIVSKSNIHGDDVHLALGNDFYYAGGVEYKQWLTARIDEINTEVNTDKLKLWLEHRNGYLREAALKRVENFRATECWSQVLELANDWVPVIRTEAKRIAERWLDDASFQEFFLHALALDALRFKQRENHISLIEKYESWLIQDRHIDLLIGAAENTPIQKPARYSFLARTNSTARRSAN